MTRSTFLLALLCGAGALISCDLLPSGDPSFYVAQGGDPRQTKFTPMGGGWPKSSTIEILILGEPLSEGGEVVTNAAWRSVGTVTAYEGMFGFNTNPFSFLVSRSICSAPPTWLKGPVVLAKDAKNGIFKFWTVGADGWFTFQPC